ncbi:MAG: class III extradiol ring-cleavage dioxygenase [Hyphomicrobiaceae bacterium]
MSSPLPAIFLSHGSPMLALDGSAAHHFLKDYAREIPRPKAILVASAHWATARPAVSAVAAPRTIHDFGGFPRALFEMTYPAPGAPWLAERTAGLLGEAGIAADIDPARGLDHGAWVPLKLLYRDADVPVTQLSIQPHLGPDHHLAVGRALRPLRDEGVLIVGSGAVTHNLEAFFTGRFEMDSTAPDWVTAFAEWLADRIAAGDTEALLDYRSTAPFGARNHPTDEHLLPLYVALGAASDGTHGARVHQSSAYGVIAMDAYAFA